MHNAVDLNEEVREERRRKVERRGKGREEGRKSREEGGKEERRGDVVGEDHVMVFTITQGVDGHGQMNILQLTSAFWSALGSLVVRCSYT